MEKNSLKWCARMTVINSQNSNSKNQKMILLLHVAGYYHKVNVSVYKFWWRAVNGVSLVEGLNFRLSHQLVSSSSSTQHSHHHASVWPSQFIICVFSSGVEKNKTMVFKLEICFFCGFLGFSLKTLGRHRQMLKGV